VTETLLLRGLQGALLVLAWTHGATWPVLVLLSGILFGLLGLLERYVLRWRPSE
jgi:hypothetical protein